MLEIYKILISVTGAIIISFYDHDEEKTKTSENNEEKTGTFNYKYRSLFVVKSVPDPELVRRAIIFIATMLAFSYGFGIQFPGKIPSRQAYTVTQQQNEYDINNPQGLAPPPGAAGGLSGQKWKDQGQGKGQGSSTALQKRGPTDLTNLPKKPTTFEEMANAFCPEYTKFQKDHQTQNLKRFNTRKCSQEKFLALATDPRSNEINRGSIDETRAVLQAESQGLISSPTRPSTKLAKTVDLDFRVKGEYSFCDIKTPVGSQILKNQNRADTLVEMSLKLGENIVKQKHNFVGKKGGPKSAESVLHVIDLGYVPYKEKHIVKENVIKGLEKAGWDKNKGIAFLNFK